MPRGDDATEGDGYLLALVNDWDTMLSDLLILDTATPPWLMGARAPRPGP
ncbi:carotenoid oxygenase family protein [Streptomyces pseudovenezuelae]